MLRLHAEVAARDAVLDLDVGDAETVAVLGPNGAGKSTALGVISGLVPADRGRAELDATVLFDTDRGIRMPPHRRRIAVLGQDAALFPHLTALGNVVFGARSAGLLGPAARKAATSWLGEVGAESLARTRATELSGGEAQRVALARALATDPRMLLLDEPLSSLDAAVAPAIRRMLGRVLDRRAAVIVTHDPLDAWTLADRVVVLEAGRVAESGTTAEVLSRPRSAFAAQLVGVSLLRGRRGPTGVLLADGRVVPAPVGGRVGDEVVATVRPSRVAVVGADGVRARITALEPRGDVLRVHTDLVAADAEPSDATRLAEGDEVLLRIDPDGVDVREF